jgi:large subunit ribosomal protein L15
MKASLGGPARSASGAASAAAWARPARAAPRASGFHVVNVGDLERFDDGATVDAAVLKTARLAKGPSDGVRILGTGELSKKLTVKAHHFSKSAKEKIEAKGGICEVILPPKKPKRNKMKPRPAAV